MIKSRILRWVGQVTRMEESRSVFKILTVKPAAKRPLRMQAKGIRKQNPETDIWAQ